MQVGSATVNGFSQKTILPQLQYKVNKPHSQKLKMEQGCTE